MKILFDCIVTQNPAGKCSTTVQFVSLAERLLQTDSVFIYWPVPDWVTPEEFKDFFPVSDRIKYIPVKQSRDRMREYNRIPPYLEEMISFTGGSWDWDVCVTVRTTQVGIMKTISTSPRQRARREWSKKFLIIEEMLILSEKPTIAMSNEQIQDRMTIEGYLAADMSFMLSYHEKKWVMDVARVHFTPARLRELQVKIKEVCQMDLPGFTLKTEHRFKGGRKMNVAFIGRLERTNARLDVINELLKNQFILHGNTIHTMILTVSPQGSPGERELDLDAIEMHHPNREQFWKMAKESLDVGVFFHLDVGLCMSMLEPLTFGMPEIVKRDLWSEGMLGPLYPFYVDTETEAFALINKFSEDYAGMYAKFEKWQANWFVPTYTRRMKEESLYDNVLAEIFAPPSLGEMHQLEGMRTNEIVRFLIKHGGEEFVINDVLEKGGNGELRLLQGKVGQHYEARTLTFSTPWNDFRIALKYLHGYEDAGVELGHLKRSSNELLPT